MLFCCKPMPSLTMDVEAARASTGSISIKVQTYNGLRVVDRHLLDHGTTSAPISRINISVSEYKT